MKSLLLAIVALVALACSSAAMAQECHGNGRSYGYGGGYYPSFSSRSYYGPSYYSGSSVTACDEFGNCITTRSTPVYRTVRVFIGYDVNGFPLYSRRTVQVGY